MKPKTVTYAHDTFTREKAREEKKWKVCVYAVAVVQRKKDISKFQRWWRCTRSWKPYNSLLNFSIQYAGKVACT